MEAQDTTPASANVGLPEDTELKSLYQEYLQKCCEVGQIRYNLDQLESQQRELEKQLETTERAVKSAASKHRQKQQERYSKLKPQTEQVQTPALELKEEQTH